MEKEREHSRFIIQRFDVYISGANTKGNFLLAFNTFLCGGIIANYKKVLDSVADHTGVCLMNIALLALFVLSLIAIFFVMKAVYPFLSSGNSSKAKYHSLIFFKSVAEYGTDAEYAKSLQDQSDAAATEDLARQAYQLAVGLRGKYRNLAISMRLTYVELILLFIILVILVIF